jgi:hypothetical protein
VIDRLATVDTDSDDRLATVIENLRAHRRVDLVVAVLGRVGGDVTRALGGLVGIDAIVVLTQPVALSSTSSLIVVDASPPRSRCLEPGVRRCRARARVLLCTQAHGARLMIVLDSSRLRAGRAAAALSLGRVFESGRFVVQLVAVVLAHAAGGPARGAWPLWATFIDVVVPAFVASRWPTPAQLGIELGGRSHARRPTRCGLATLAHCTTARPSTALLLAVIASFVVAAIADWPAFRREAVLAATAPAWCVRVGHHSARRQRGAHRARARRRRGRALLVQNLAVLDKGRSWLVSHRPNGAIGSLQHCSQRWPWPACLAPAPRAGAEPILDFADQGNRGDGGAAIAPASHHSSTERQAQRCRQPRLFTVTADHPDYWRSPRRPLHRRRWGAGPSRLKAARSTGLPTSGPPDRSIRSTRWLMVSGGCLRHTVRSREPRRHAGREIVVDTGRERRHRRELRYSVDSIVSRVRPPSPRRCAATATRPPRRAVHSSHRACPARSSRPRPPSSPRGAMTPYGRALRDFFRSGDSCTTRRSIRSIHPTRSRVFRERRGFCVQFATR